MAGFLGKIFDKITKYDLIKGQQKLTKNITIQDVEKAAKYKQAVEQLRSQYPNLFKKGASSWLPVAAGTIGLRRLGKTQEHYFQSRRAVRQQNYIKGLFEVAGIEETKKGFKLSKLPAGENTKFLDLISGVKTAQEYGVKIKSPVLKQLGLDIENVTVGELANQYNTLNKYSGDIIAGSNMFLKEQNLNTRSLIKYGQTFTGQMIGWNVFGNIMGQLTRGPNHAVYNLNQMDRIYYSTAMLANRRVFRL